MSRRLLLHVGAPKTGTSLLQHALFTHRERLADAGVLYAAERPDAHFLAALDLMQLTWGGLELQAAGAWEHLAETVRAWRGTAIVSHEILGAASPEHAARALRDLTGDDTEVHLVLSARDLARQVPAEWQENVKHRRTRTYAEFLAAVRDPARSAPVAQWFWDVQDLPALIERWGATLPPEQVHIVTVPPPGAPRTALWDRFVEAFSLTDLDLVPEGRDNASLGVPESAMLRRLNTRLNSSDDTEPAPLNHQDAGHQDAGHQDAGQEDAAHDSAPAGLPSSHYRSLIRELVVHNHLAGRPGSPRLVLPPALHDWVSETSRSWVDQLGARGCTVHGDLADLLVSGPAQAYVDPDHGDEHGVAEAAVDALAIMTREASRLREVEQHLGEEIAGQRAQLDRFHGTLSYRAKRRLVGLSHTNVVARGAYAVYRRLRGRSSTST